jgi:hypothetical protein
MLQHLFLDCGLLDWIVQLPQSIVPTPHPGRQLQAAAKTPLRAGYLGHITHVAGALDSLSRQRPPNDAPGSEAGTSGREEVTSSKVSEYTKDHEGWIKCVSSQYNATSYRSSLSESPRKLHFGPPFRPSEHLHQLALTNAPLTSTSFPLDSPTILQGTSRRSCIRSRSSRTRLGGPVAGQRPWPWSD